VIVVASGLPAPAIRTFRPASSASIQYQDGPQSLVARQRMGRALAAFIIFGGPAIPPRSGTWDAVSGSRT
jgi:hypothetical protein